MTISSLGLQVMMSNALQNEQSTLTTLSEQLASGQQYQNLTDYSPVDAKQLLNFQDAIQQKQAYNAAMQTVQTRPSIYNSTMGDMENVAESANTLATQNSSYNPTTVANLQSQVQAYLSQVGDDLNQQDGGRYIYAGMRYNTQPVDVSTLNNAPQATTTQPALPDYDTEYQAGTTSDANAYTADSVLVDSNFSVTYGVTSTNPSFQQLINGLRYMNAAATAGQSGDTTTYQSDMQQAAGLLSTALTGIQGLNAGVANNRESVDAANHQPDGRHQQPAGPDQQRPAG